MGPNIFQMLLVSFCFLFPVLILTCMSVLCFLSTIMVNKDVYSDIIIGLQGDGERKTSSRTYSCRSRPTGRAGRWTRLMTTGLVGARGNVSSVGDIIPFDTIHDSGGYTTDRWPGVDAISIGIYSDLHGKRGHHQCCVMKIHRECGCRVFIW